MIYIMNLLELVYILKVAELRSVTGAADALHISQPELSRYIHDVEKELGAKIFDRSTNPISLTYAGECYTQSAKRILLEHENLQREIRDITHHMTWRLRIGDIKRQSFIHDAEIIAYVEREISGDKDRNFTDGWQKTPRGIKRRTNRHAHTA